MTNRTHLRILLSAYACEPDKGSEPGVGWNWALALVHRGHDVWVLTRANNRKPIERAVGKLSEDERVLLHFIYYDLPRWAAWWKSGGRCVQLYYALWQRYILPVAKVEHSIITFDLVHHLTFGVWRQPTQLYKLGIPVIFGPVGGGESAPHNLVRTLTVKDQIRERVRDAANRLGVINPGLRSCLREARWVVAKTTETAHWLKRAGAVSTTSFEIGIDASRFRPRDDQGSKKSIKCLYAGRLIGLKGIHLAIAAVAVARKWHCDVTLTIIGQGPMRHRLTELASQLGVTNYVQFIGWLDQDALCEQYRQHDVLLFPSLHDSSGNVILESFAHALPAVCLKLGGPGEMVDATNGIAVEPTGDPVVGLAGGLQGLAEDPELRRRLGANARKYALGTTWDAVVAAVYEPVEAALLI